jgi:hypothetical protein
MGMKRTHFSWSSKCRSGVWTSNDVGAVVPAAGGNATAIYVLPLAAHVSRPFLWPYDRHRTSSRATPKSISSQKTDHKLMAYGGWPAIGRWNEDLPATFS